MYMEKKKIIIISIAAVLVILLIIGAVKWYKRPADMPNQAETETYMEESSIAFETESAVQSSYSPAENETDGSSYLPETEEAEIPEYTAQQQAVPAGTGLVKDSGRIIEKLEQEPWNAVTEFIVRNDEDEADEVKDMVLLHKFEQADIALYYYEYHSTELSNYNRILKRIALQYDGTYQMFNIDIYDWLLERSNLYGCYDYDDDGELEVALVLDYGFDVDKCYHQLYMFDYNNSSGEYEVYRLNNTGYMAAVDEGIESYYGVDIDDMSGLSIIGSDYMQVTNRSVLLDDYNEIYYGDNVFINLYDDGSIEINVPVEHVINELNYMDDGLQMLEPVENYTEGSLIYNIDYKGSGVFEAGIIGFEKY